MSAAVNKKLKKARSLLGAKKYQQAFALFSEVLKLSPNQPEALHHLALFAQAQGDHGKAMQLLSAATQHAPKYHEAHYDLGVMYEKAGNIGKAADHYMAAWQLSPDMKHYLYGFAKVVEPMRFTGANDPFMAVVAQAIVQPTINGERLLPAWFSMFEHTALWKCVQTAGAQASPSKETLEALADPQLCLALCNSVVGILPFEQALIAIRKCCLLDWTLADIPLVLLAAFAYQGFRNEYVWEIGPDEQAACDALAAKAKAGTLGISELFLLAAYRPLHRIEGIETCEPLLEKDDSGFARDIWRQQVEEPQEEEQIKPEIPVLTSIEDTVSQNVQAQYEVNPYPRWSTLDTVEPLEFKTHFERAFPHYPYITAIPSSCDVLVAGSGSGKQPLTLANTFKRFHVTGVDLSKTSLAYAIRKQKEVAPGVTVKFAQADILKLEEAFEPESFDMVQCTGVLHHMDDPMAGWKVLHRLLKPKGLMKIGLYSEIARRGVTVLREKIAKEGLPYTDEGIRRLREHIKAHPDEPDYKWVLQTIDFYSTSACRDLLFHVQEHQFTIPKIEAAIAELGLEFIGWDHPSPHVPKAFNEKFPEHEPPGSFEQWDTFEQEHPTSFASMYQFWLRKP